MTTAPTLNEPGRIAYSIPQFCTACAVGRTFVYEEIKGGRLRARKAGRRTLIEAAEARRWFGAAAANHGISRNRLRGAAGRDIQSSAGPRGIGTR